MVSQRISPDPELTPPTPKSCADLALTGHRRSERVGGRDRRGNEEAALQIRRRSNHNATTANLPSTVTSPPTRPRALGEHPWTPLVTKVDVASPPEVVVSILKKPAEVAKRAEPRRHLHHTGLPCALVGRAQGKRRMKRGDDV